jgi:hypothetical protein
MSIVDEFHSLPPVPIVDRTAAGIPAKVETITRTGGIRQACARFAFEPALGRYFEFSGEGLPCWCVATYEGGLLVDIVAWPLGKPRRYAALCRKAWALGGDDALSPNRLGEDPDRLPPIHVYRDPMSWLRAGAEGLVILDAARARDELWPHSELRAEDETHGRELEALMVSPVWAGKVMVPRSSEAAA